MIKLTFCLVRLPTLTREQFQKYWFENHAPLVTRHREVLRIKRYVQLHSGTAEMAAAIRASRNAPEEFDGVAQLWWDSFEDIATNTSEAARAAGAELLADERKFIDLAKSPLWFGEEKVIFG
jgi:uncharacterized protein (TIGR02118 family)